MSKSRWNPNPRGRPKGSPNRTTLLAREAIAKFVEGNVHRLQKWLDAIAEGVPDHGEGNEGKFIVPPNPERAFLAFQSIIEYHVPKLARTEIVDDREKHATELADDELEAIARAGSAGAADAEGGPAKSNGVH